MRAGSGVWALLRMQWRTAWLWLLLSPALLAALVVAIASGVKDLYGEEAERTIYAATMGASPAQIAMNGRGYDLDVLGGIAAYEVGFMGQLLLPLVGVLLAVRLTRAPESNGVLDLLTSTRVHRTAVPAAAFMSAGAPETLTNSPVRDRGQGMSRPLPPTPMWMPVASNTVRTDMRNIMPISRSSPMISRRKNAPIVPLSPR